MGDEVDTKDAENTLRQHVASFPIIIIFSLATYFSWKYFNKEFKPLECFIIAALTSYSSFFPIRLKSHFANNEFSLADYPILLGVCLLDPFQFAASFSAGYFISLIVYRYSIKRGFVNIYSFFIEGLLTGIVFHSPLDLHSKFFIPLCIGALLFYNFIDTLAFFAVSKFEAKNIIFFMKSSEKYVSIGIGILIGIPTCIVFEYKPEYSPILFAIFAIAIISINKYVNYRSRNYQLKSLLDFMSDTSDINRSDKSDDRLLEIAKSILHHDGLIIGYQKPENNQIGKIIHSDESGDKWLLINKADYSKKRIKKDELLLDEIVSTAKKAYLYRDLQEQLYTAARYDFLTGLLNRSTLEEFTDHELGLVKRGESSMSLMFIDIDLFKPVNDLYGHNAGDELLRYLARRLELTIREQDMVARIGGDEFVILCRNISKIEAIKLAERVHQEICKPVIIDNSFLDDNKEKIEITIGASIGISNAPDDGTTFEKLLKVADERMYKAKKSTKCRIVSDDSETKTG